MKRKIIIIGSGIIGLTTAITLLEKGYEVQLVATDFPPNTTSDQAGAVWFPYRIDAPKKALLWSKNSYLKWQQLTKEENSGVSMVDFSVIEKEDIQEVPWWAAALPDGAYKQQRTKLPDGFAMTHCLNVPFIEPRYCLPFLMNYAVDLGLTKEKKSINSLALFCALHPQHFIVNCSGLGAQKLAADDAVYPVQGQAIIMKRLAKNIHFKADDGPSYPTYMFTRKEELIIGGSAISNNYTTKPTESLSENILQRCAKFYPEVAQQEIIKQQVGLRPCRPAIRVAWDEQLPVIHNYGHGGGGYTTSWGCGIEVLELLEGNIDIKTLR